MGIANCVFTCLLRSNKLVGFLYIVPLLADNSAGVCNFISKIFTGRTSTLVDDTAFG